ncbi:MAG: DUF3887 domain-containing protein [Thermoguttaceae bacterium]
MLFAVSINAQAEKPSYEKVADALVARFANADFSDAGFTQTMKDAQAADIAKALWDDFLKQFGTFVKSQVVKTESLLEFKRVYEQCEFENGTVVFMVVVDKNDLVAGLFVMSVEKNDASARKVIVSDNNDIPQLDKISIDKKVSDFIDDSLVTPESAYAAFARALANQDSATFGEGLKVLNVPRLRGNVGKPLEPDWAAVLLSARIISVHSVEDKEAIVIAKLDGENVRKPYDVRYFEKTNGKWLNTGNDRFDSPEDAEEKFVRILQIERCRSLIPLLKLDNMKSYRVDKKIADFPNEIDLSTPEKAYATGKHLIVSDRDDKIEQLEKLQFHQMKMPEREREQLEKKIDSDWAERYINEFVVFEVYQFGNDHAFVFGKREFDKLYDGNFFQKKNDGLWYNVGNLQNVDAKKMSRDVESALERLKLTGSHAR